MQGTGDGFGWTGEKLIETSAVLISGLSSYFLNACVRASYSDILKVTSPHGQMTMSVAGSVGPLKSGQHRHSLGKPLKHQRGKGTMLVE